MGITKKAYHYYQHKDKAPPDFNANDGKFLNKLAVVEKATQSEFKGGFWTELNRLMKHFKHMLHKLTNIDIQNEYSDFQKLISTNTKHIDWQHCKLMKILQNNKYTPDSNTISSADPIMLSRSKYYCCEADISYILETCKKYQTECKKASVIAPIHEKCMATLQRLLHDWQLSYLLPMIEDRYEEPTWDNTIKLFLQIRYLLKLRKALLAILRQILIKEQTMKWYKKLLLWGKVDHTNQRILENLQKDYEKPQYLEKELSQNYNN